MATAKTKIQKKKKDKNRTRNIIILVVVVAITVVGGVYAAKNSNTDGKIKLKPYQETEEVTIGEINISVKATGNLEPWEKIDLRPEASGKVMKLLVEEGDIVKEGQVVAILDQTSQEYALESAKASVALAKAG
ncbi:biotin/lipoyl-binding protein, partial [bacterium]|nr:biotin/lipoyl-binding protein [bacterium]MBU1024783.1 biotin/lipoyl-binding protein [bacterium]